jgi:hypothetical protein
MNFFKFIRRPFPDPGTGNFAYVQNTSPPIFDAGGAGRRVYGQMQTQQYNVMQTNVATMEGLGGLLQGQFASQSLMEPDNGI